MKTLFLLTLLIPFIGFAQEDPTKWYTTENVYNRDANTILDYSKEFVTRNTNLFSPNENDTFFIDAGKFIEKEGEIIVKSRYFFRRSNKFCFGSMIFDIDIAFMAKQGKTRVEIRKVDYSIIPPGGTSNCKGSGAYMELKSAECCNSFTGIDQFLKEKFDIMLRKYKSFLVSKRKDETW